MCMYVCMHHKCSGDHRVQKRMLESLELETEGSEPPTWVLGTKPQSSGSVASMFNCGTDFPDCPTIYFS